MFFFVFCGGRGFCGSYSMLFSEAPAFSFCNKKNFEIIFCCIFNSICVISKRVSQIFNISFQTGNINIFVLHGAFFSRSVQLKNSFSDEKNISDKIRDTFQQRSCQSLARQSIKIKFLHREKLEVCKVIHNLKLH